MRVEKYQKKKDGRYLVTFSNKKQLDLYEEVILKYELLLNKEIDAKRLNDIIAYNQECDVYYVALAYLKVKMRTKKEVFTLLKKKNYPENYIANALEKLETQGYIQDFNYANSFLYQQLLTTSRGPKKIAYELEKKGIAKEIIDEVMIGFDSKQELEKIEKIVKRMMASNRNKGSLLLQKKIEQELLIQGFHKENIEAILAKTTFQDDQLLYQKEYDKLYKKLSKKYSGDELHYKIKQKLYQRGFHYDS